MCLEREIMKIIVNPFGAYVLGFVFVLLVYQLGWSEFYPSLSIELLYFLLATVFFSLILYFMVPIKREDNEINFMEMSQKKIIIIISIIYIIYIGDFIYHGVVPLFDVIQGGNFFYHDFKGMPFFHPLNATFQVFFANYIFCIYCYKKEKKFLISWIVLLIPLLLSFKRGDLVLSLSTALFIYLFRLSKLKIISIGKIFFTLLIGMYIFGVAGNYRTTNEFYKEPTNDSSLILKWGKASEAFKESYIPKEYFWSYIYISSPLANLQYNIENNKGEWKGFLVYLNATIYEIMPDFISKRYNDFFCEIGQTDVYLIIPAFNVATYYAESFSRNGFLGMFTIYIYMNLLIIFLVKNFRKSKFYILIISVLIVMTYFNLFSNMMINSSFIFQLVYPVLFSLRPFNKII